MQRQPRELSFSDSAGRDAHQKGACIPMEYDIEDVVTDELTDSPELVEAFVDDAETLVALKIKRAD
jgi:hypothetical protein